MNMQPSAILMSLIENGKISRETICIAAKISEETLADYLLENRSRLNSEDVLYLDKLAMLVGQGLPLVTEDERVKAILESLIYEYGFTSEQLSRLLNIELELLEAILNSEEVDLDKRYQLAVKEAYLFYALKREK